MKTKALVLSVTILIVLLQPAFNLARNANAQQQAQTAIRITPAQTGNLAVGEYFSVNVSLENCLDVYAVQVDIRYDPMVLQPVQILSTSASIFPLTAKNETNIFREDWNYTYNGPTYGEIYYVATHSGPVAGLDGEALLLTVNFKVMSKGSTPITLVQYASDTSDRVGTYFMNTQVAEIIPQLYNANYGQPAPPANSISTSPKDSGQVQSAALALYFLPFAALCLIGIGRKMNRKTSNP